LLVVAPHHAPAKHLDFAHLVGNTTATAGFIDDANRRVWERSVADPVTSGMGTTVTAAYVDAAQDRVIFGQVGDSRAYRLRGDGLEQVTTDHSLVAELVRTGVLTPEEAERHPQRSAITRAVGTESAIDADVIAVPAEVGDLYLLCSDGLTDMLTADEIAATILGADRDPTAAADALVEAANAKGGDDNITVVLFELVEGDPDVEAEVEPKTDGQPGLQTTDAPTATAEPVADADVRTHGAGPGGRLAAIALLVILVAAGLLVLYWGITR